MTAGTRLPAMSLRLSDVTALLDGWYDPAWAEDWDAVGLVCGDPEQPVARVLFAVDPAPAVVDEALAWGADLVVCHHPLLLSPVHGVAATTPKGRVVHRLQRTGTALLTAHTNADVPADGVNESLARAVGILDPQVVVAPATGPRQAGLRAARARGRGAPPRRPAPARSATTTAPSPPARDGSGRWPAPPGIGGSASSRWCRVARRGGLPRAARRSSRDAAATPTRSWRTTSWSAAPGPPRRGHGRIGRLASRRRCAVRRGCRGAAGTAHGVRVAGDPDRRVRDRRGRQRVRRLHARHRAAAPTPTST